MSDTYTSYEASIEQGRPLRFYRFTLGTVIWRYVNADEDITVAGQTFLACPISDDGIKQTGEAQADAMQITAPDNVGPAIVYSTSPPSKELGVEILQMHEGMTTLRICYVGTVSQVGSPRAGQALISVQTMSATMKRTGLRLCYQRSCPYAVYDLSCKVNKADHAIHTFIRSITGSVVRSDGAVAKPDGFFANGFMEYTDPVRGVQQIMIESSTGTSGDLAVFDDVQELAVGQPITLYPGCNQTPDVCQVVFNNYLNYGGWEYMPGKSPYDGNPIF